MALTLTPLDHHVAVVTGASSGIGLATFPKAAEREAVVVPVAKRAAANE